LLVLCGGVARYPALQGQLIWDDDYLVRSNPFIRSPLLILETFRHYLFPDSFATHYRPVQNISYGIDYLFWAGDPFGYHVSNLLWHIAGGVLLYFLLRRLLVELKTEIVSANAAFVIALLWLVHPVHSAAIDYISGRADSLACVFSCAAWLTYLHARGAKRIVSRSALFFTAAFLALLALGSRESACMWLAIFLLYLFFVDSSAARQKAATLCVVLSVLATYIGLRHLPAAAVTASATDQASPANVRLVLMLRALGDYGRLLVWPGNLHMERSVESPSALLGNEGWRVGIASEYLSLVGVVVGALLVYGSIRQGKMRVVRRFGAAWFVVAFLPISNIVELNATVAEHWLYLPSIGLLMFLAGCALELPPHVRRAGLAFASIAVVALTTRSIIRSGDWMNAETFYRHSLASGAAKPRIALNLGVALAGKGDYATAEPLLRRVVRLFPDYPIAVNALAHVLLREGKIDESNHYFELARQIAERTRDEYPRTWIAALNVAHMRVRENNLEAALSVADKARRDYPGTWELISFESEMLRKLKGPSAALPLVADFARDNWWHAGAAIAQGKLYSELGRYAEAEAAFRHATRLDVHGVEALNLIALLDLRRNNLNAALTVQQQALSRQPDQPRQHLLLSDILQRMGRNNEARAALAQVSQLQSEVASETLPN
jgi:Flp pilus assembly protein TadD